MTQAYVTPQATPSLVKNIDKVGRRRKFWLRAIWISIAGVVVPLLFGLVGTVVGMVGAFGNLSDTGDADPEALAGNISFALLTTMWGLIISVVAFIILIGVLIRFFTLPKVTPNPQQETNRVGGRF